MTQEELNQIIKDSLKRRADLEVSKGREYTQGSEDRLANFKRAAEILKISPLKVWAVYFNKHWDSLMNFIKSGKEFSTESIESRIDDMQVYLDLLRGLIVEHKRATQVKAFCGTEEIRQTRPSNPDSQEKVFKFCSEKCEGPFVCKNPWHNAQPGN